MQEVLWAPSAPLPGAPALSCPSHGLTLRSTLPLHFLSYQVTLESVIIKIQVDRDGEPNGFKPVVKNKKNNQSNGWWYGTGIEWDWNGMGIELDGAGIGWTMKGLDWNGMDWMAPEWDGNGMD